MSYKIIVSGGRDFKDAKFLNSILDRLHKEKVICKIVFGCARGVDALALDWAKRNMVDFARYEADWESHGKAAGPIRNKRMIEENLDAKILLAFPGGSGTANAVSIAKGFNLKTINLGE